MTAAAPGVLALGRREAPVHLDSGLVEQAVLLAVERVSAEERRRFRRTRDPIYELDPAAREGAFQTLHARWFERLGLADPLLASLGEQPSVAESTTACLVVPAARRKEEHADLRDGRTPGAAWVTATAVSQEAERPVLVVQLLAATLADPVSLQHLLRRELYYVADMLDPSFGYDPERAVAQTSGLLAGLLRERHELLWRVVVDGRLAARGHLTDAEAARLQARFRSTFPMLEGSSDAVFQGLFAGPRPSHRELMRLARFPAGTAAGPGECPLCQMPAPTDRPEREGLSARVIAAVRRDFADWRPEDGMCSHCADLYDLRERVRPTPGGPAPGLATGPIAAGAVGGLPARWPRSER